MIVLFGSGLDAPLAPATDADRRHVAGRRVEELRASTSARAPWPRAGIFALVARAAVDRLVASARRRARSLGGGGGAPADRLRTDRDTPDRRSSSSARSAIVGVHLGRAGLPHEPPRRRADPGARVPVLGRLLAHHGRGRLDLVPALGHDDRRPDGDLRRRSCSSGWEGSAYSRLALMIGAIVCIAIRNAGHVLAGPEDRLPRRRDAGEAAGGAPGRRPDLGAGRGLDRLPPQRGRDERGRRSPAVRRRRRRSLDEAADVDRARPTESSTRFVRLGARGAPRRSRAGATTSSTARRGEARYLREDGHRRRAPPGAAGEAHVGRDRRAPDAQAPVGPDPARRGDRDLHRAARASAR